MPQHVVIAGGGFGGYYTAKALERRTPKDVRITLVNDVNFMLYTPLLPGAAAGTLEPRHVVVPLRERLKRTELRLGWVTGGDSCRQHVARRADRPASERRARLRPACDRARLGVAHIADPRAERARDRLQDDRRGDARFATGWSATSRRPRRSMTPDAAALVPRLRVRRRRLCGARGRRRAAGLRATTRLGTTRAAARSALRWILVEAAARSHAARSSRTLAALHRSGCCASAGSKCCSKPSSSAVTDRLGHALDRGDRSRAGSSAGRRASRATRSPDRLGLPLERGRIVCGTEMRVDGLREHLGARRHRRDSRPGAALVEPCPPTAQHAIRQGKLMGQQRRQRRSAIVAQVKPFTFKTLGAFAELGRHKAVANLMGARVRGFPAWAVCRFYHLAWMPGFRRKIRLIADWTIDFWFHRDTAELGQLGHPPALDRGSDADDAGPGEAHRPLVDKRRPANSGHADGDQTGPCGHHPSRRWDSRSCEGGEVSCLTRSRSA